jgi:hypothetical protein
MDTIKNSPRNAFLGFAADKVNKLRELMGVTGDFVIGDAARSARR